MKNFLYEHNEHWLDKRYNTGYHRELMDELKAVMQSDHILAISGVRRCGKSFLMKQMINALLDQGVPPQNILFANLEFPAMLRDPSTKVLDELVETYRKLKQPTGKVYLFFDEIQTIRQWEVWMKSRYDLHKGMMKFVITGSNSRLLSSEFASLLSGRVIEKRLFPFSLKEILDVHAIPHATIQEQMIYKAQILHFFDLYLQVGGMPEVVLCNSSELRSELLASYFNGIIYKDIVPRFGIRDSLAIQNLSLYALENVTSLMNFKKVADAVHTTRDNVRDFLYYLHQAYLNFLVQKFDFSSRSRVLSQKKCYAIDTGFVNTLTLRFSPNRGKLLENCVFLELKKRYEEVFYYRNAGECDFIIYHQQKGSIAVQVCDVLTPENRARELRGLRLGCNYLSTDVGFIITYDQEEVVQMDNIKVVVTPFWKWVLE